ncbi:Hvo_1808 family surface protein [Natrinema salsiterrestre]|uniref:Hvo_1808 family surface protein n=1 Tax=Natrinema salsiterrestre TaxID=2950540 RepID=A0A9Q4L0A7_9EURY|nr:Hvo_1808 family surface protein [Natrinema salsiterrestre]MDF9747595.1 Hvo_1808 family surface protein [Natrinema salsiterrestre]
MRVKLLAVLVLVVLSGCALPGNPGAFDTDRELGSVGDYSHDDVFEFDTSDGLTEAQLEAVKYRSMARIEVVRGLKYERDVELEVMNRSEYRDQRAAGTENASPFRNELWRGAFVVDGETDVDRAFDDLYGDSVQGYYVNDRIVIITDDTENIRINRRTLVHELTHALQDQHFGIARESETIDGLRAENGLLEGEAAYVPTRYDRRCGDDWQCLPDRHFATASGEALAERPFNVGLFLSIYVPYAEGPTFVADLHDRGGWDAIDRAHANPPRSTTQLIHPDRYPDTEPVAVDIPDRSSDEWQPITDNTGDSDGTDGEPGTETIGEATLFATLWANGVIERPLTEGAAEYSQYNYSHPATAGWAGDSVQVYRHVNDSDRTGHVWRLSWESPADATAFADAYRRLLTNRGADSVETAGDGIYRVPDGDPFAGAYRVSVTDEAVEIVGAPTVDDLEGVHATESGVKRSLEPAVTRGPASPPSPAVATSIAEPAATPHTPADG